MPELTVMHVGLLALMLIGGAIMGWIFRADRCAKEKIAVNASWQEQLESQQSEHNRLAEQNKSLMEQISQYQASHKDYNNRAKELSESLKEAFARRDELQRQLKDLRGNLDVAIAQRDRLRSELRGNPQAQAAALKEKDDKIFKLSRELTSWQSRVPPLVERFQERDREARSLAEELQKTRVRLRALEDLVKSDQTRIEAMDADSLPDGGDASNEPNAMTSENDVDRLQDQIEAGCYDETEPGADDHPQGRIDTGSSDEIIPVEQFAEADPDEPREDLVDAADIFAAADEDDPAPAQARGEETGATPDDVTPAGQSSQSPPPTDAGTALEQEFSSVFASLPDPRNKHDAYDDLKLIKGIGPSIEKTLNELGVHRFQQIAEMSEYDIDRVAQQLKGFRSRIYREDWIGQARDLQYQKNKNQH